MPSERAALIAAIRESPDDDVLRLACADWFEEQGDEASVARADFIRTQIQRANLPPEDERQSELQARELRLLKRYAPVWCGSHFVFKKCRFRRGFIEYVHLHLQHFQHHRRQMFALEPVREISLTGWCRAPDDLLRRVAGCEEWRYVESLRIHHQGPHNDPRSNLVLLLESPHLTRLRALRGTLVQFDADARRRFERLPVLRQLRELHFPTLDTLMQKPGEWFSDGGAAFASQWGELRSLTLPYYLTGGLLHQLTEMPSWDRLTALSLVLGWEANEVLAILRDRLPAPLEELRLDTGNGPPDYPTAASFFERLARAPLRRLRMRGIALMATALGCLHDETSRWELRELSLEGHDTAREQVRAIAESPGTSKLRSLRLRFAHNRDEVITPLFSAGPRRSLVHLDLTGTRLGPEGARALASAQGWDNLRSLDLTGTGLDGADLRSLLSSPNLQRLTCLGLGAGEYRGVPTLNISPDIATAITRLPHLANLHLSVDYWGSTSEQALSASGPPAWFTVSAETQYDVQKDRAARAPERSPPLDPILGVQLGRTGRE